MKNAEFEIKHINQTVEDFQKNIHRFKVEYNGKSYDAYCVGALTINIIGHIPKDVYNKVINKIWDMIDECENTDAWPVPDGAQKIADDYCKEEFYQEVSE